MILLTSQKNRLFDIIESHELSPSQFEICINPSQNIAFENETEIVFLNSEYYFVFEGGTSVESSLSARFQPGYDCVFEIREASNWANMLKHFNVWGSYLKREITTADKWERLKNELHQINATFDVNNDKFTAFEYEDLKIRMNQLKQGIQTIGLLPEQIDIINNKIDHLTEMALTMNKFDWKSQFVGTIINLSMALTFSNEARTAFWGLI